MLRFDGCTQGPGLVALSFARSARGELEDRVRRRWGSHALRWPHKVWTLDSLHCAILVHLLRTGQITWPGGQTELTVHDSWRGQDGSGPLSPERPWRRVVTLNGRQVVSETRAIYEFGHGYTTKGPYETMLAAGVCTHDEVRQILEIVVWNSELRPAVVEYLRTSMKALIVDEVFDGDRLDLAIVHQAAAAGIPSTLIGDPWQALYEFRGARPELVAKIVTGPLVRHVAGDPVVPIRNAGDAASRAGAARRRGGHGAGRRDRRRRCGSGLTVEAAVGRSRTTCCRSRSARSTIGRTRPWPCCSSGSCRAISGTFRPAARKPRWCSGSTRRSSAATPVCSRRCSTVWREGARRTPTAALALLRTTLTDMGSRPIRKMKEPEEADRIQLLGALGRRLGTAHLIPGMTIHQAKGREWASVGVYLVPDEEHHLAAGLSQERPSDRALYVALTRAKRSVYRV